MLKSNRLKEALTIAETMALNTIFDDQLLKQSLYELGELFAKVEKDGEDSLTNAEVNDAIDRLHNVDPIFIDEHLPQLHELKE